MCFVNTITLTPYQMLGIFTSVPIKRLKIERLCPFCQGTIEFTWGWGGQKLHFRLSFEEVRVKISYFCHPKADMNEVVPRQNRRKHYSFHFAGQQFYCCPVEQWMRISVTVPAASITAVIIIFFTLSNVGVSLMFGGISLMLCSY